MSRADSILTERLELPIPRSAWRRILQFVNGSRTGRIVLVFRSGKIVSATSEEDIDLADAGAQNRGD